MRYLLFVIAIAFSACSLKESTTVYKPYSTIFEEPSDSVSHRLLEDFNSIEKPLLKIQQRLDSSWTYFPGDDHEGLNDSIRMRPGVSVSLPHRMLMPDRTLWYHQRFNNSNPCVIAVRADDGAQLYVDGRVIMRDEYGFFQVNATGQLSLSIRVLNNAMTGGLNRVTCSSVADYRTYLEETKRYDRLKQLVDKMLLMPAHDVQFSELVARALKSTTPSSLDSCERYVLNKPRFTGPWLSRKDSTTMVVMVKQDGHEPVEIRYGTSKGNLSQSQTLRGTILQFALTGLQAGTVYYYSLRSAETETPVYSFENQTAMDEFSFNVWADSQSGWKSFNKNIQNTLPYQDAFGIGVGDLVGDGSDAASWTTFFDILSASAARRPYYLIAGNHDYDGYYDDLIPKHYLAHTDYQPATYFSWYFKNAAFIALNPNDEFPIGIAEGSEQYRWFRQEIKSKQWQQATWRFVLLHQTLYSQGWKGYEGDVVLRNVLEPFIEPARIDFIISGHTHDYERLLKKYGEQEVMFLIVGGAGGSLEPPESSDNPRMDTVIKQHHMGRFWITGDALRFEAKDLEDKTMDSFERGKNNSGRKIPR